MHTEKQPVKEIHITFQEEDRQKARPFIEGNNCLVATALKRMGYKKILCTTYEHDVDGFYYFSPDTSHSGLFGVPIHQCYNGNPGPYYSPEVVGKQITLTLRED